MELIIGHVNLIDAWAATHDQPPYDPPRRSETGAAARAVDLWGDRRARALRLSLPYKSMQAVPASLIEMIDIRG